MDRNTTLITGPSGTGKELVARALALSRYIPFNPDTEKFADDFAGAFHALNLSALTSTLIDSELFGHCEGAFTGATRDRDGWLGLCQSADTLFLDEIGDVGTAVQVKLLRVLETRKFQRIGETETWIEEKLGHDYPWPGNVRELQQCVRNMAVHGEYHPLLRPDQDAPDDPWPALAAATSRGTLTAEQVMLQYCTLLYAKTGSYTKAAQQLKLDRRTVQHRIDQHHLDAAKRFWGTQPF